MIVIGIVGPPAGGKSTVAKIIAGEGLAWVNADRLAHATLRLHEVKLMLRDWFGDGIFDTCGRVHRKRLSQLVFGDDAFSRQSLEYIEGVVHPIVGQMASRKLRRLAQGTSPGVVLDAPLLIEAEWHLQCDEIWYIDSSWQQRVEWAVKRSWTADQLRQREMNQLSLPEKRRHATRIIDNSQGPNHTQMQVLDAWRELKNRSDACTDSRRSRS